MSVSHGAGTATEDKSDAVRPSISRVLGFGAAGIVLALVLVGQALYVIHTRSRAQPIPPVPPHATPAQRLTAQLTAALGRSDRRVQRFRLILGSRHGSPARDLTLTWAINSDISAGTVGNGAEYDVYDILRTVYTSGLSIASTHLIGTYPMRDRRGQYRETPVMRLVMKRSVASLAGKVGWDTLSAQDVWGLLDRRYVNPAVRPLPSE